MDYKTTEAPNTTVTINRDELLNQVDNIYEAIAIIGKRANQINSEIKTELIQKLDEFSMYNETLEEVFENKEQIEVSKFYERLPKPTSIAVDEFIHGRTYFRMPEDDES